MIIWKGYGILAPLVGLGALLAFNELGMPYALASASVLAGIFSFVFGRKWNGAPAKVMVDKSTGQEIHIKPEHSIFWIKLEYWSIIFIAFGLYIFAQNMGWLASASSVQ